MGRGLNNLSSTKIYTVFPSTHILNNEAPAVLEGQSVGGAWTRQDHLGVLLSAPLLDH